MNLKKKIIYLVAISVLLTVSLVTTSFNKPDTQEKPNVNSVNEDDNPIYYWYFLNVRLDNRLNVFKVSGTSGGINNGYLIDFEKQLWNGLSKRKIAVGPFLTKDEAVNSKRLYKSKKEKINQLPQGEVPDRVHWFAITFDQSDRLKIFIMRRTPGAVNSGSEKDFINAFYEQLGKKQLSIGPFYYYEQAEEAKNIYRRNE